MLGDDLRDPTTEAMFGRLRAKFASWSALAGAKLEEVEPLIAAVPGSDVKAADIIAALGLIARRSGALRMDWLANWTVDDALRWLGELPGVSQVAASAVLNVSTLQRRVLVVDDAGLRIAQRIGLCERADGVAACQDRLTEEAPPGWEAETFTELYVQLSRLAEAFCHRSGPDCGGCPVRDLCARAAAEKTPTQPRHVPANDTGPLSARLDDYLRRRISRIEAEGVSARTLVEAGIKLGRPIDEHFVGGVFPAGVHQCAGARMDDGASRYILALAALAAAPVTKSAIRLLVIQEEDAVREYGQLHGPGLQAYGVDLGEAAFVRAADSVDALVISDEALRTNSAPFLILELRRGAGRADAAVTRRLNLQARRAGVFLFLITPDLDGASAAMTRWRLAADASSAPRKRVGPPSVRMDLVRNRSGRSGSWTAEWSPGDRRFRAIRDLGVASAAAGYVHRAFR